MLVFVFIQAGALHGFAKTFIWGLIACACLMTGMMYASSCAVLNRVIIGSGAPSSYEYGQLHAVKSDDPIGTRMNDSPMPVVRENRSASTLSRSAAVRKLQINNAEVSVKAAPNP